MRGWTALAIALMLLALTAWLVTNAVMRMGEAAT